MKTKLLIGLVLLFFNAFVPIESFETKMQLLSGERWEIHIELILPPESPFLTSEFDQMLASESMFIEQEEIDFSWRKESPDNQGRIKYIFDYRGQGYELLNTVSIFDHTVSVEEESGRILVNTISNFNDQSIAKESKFVLQGGHIITSNGNQINSSTVEWINPIGTMEAVLTEGSSFNWLWLLFIFLVLGGGFAAYWFIFRISPTTTVPGISSPGGKSQPGSLRYCAECGTQMHAESKFCPNCGAGQ